MPAIVALHELTTADRRYECRLDEGIRRWLLDDDECGLVEWIGIERKSLDAARGTAKLLQHRRQAADITKAFHSGPRFGGSKLVARLNHHQMTPRHAQQLGENGLFVAVV